MTDITDQDRRDAREWAEKIDPTYRGNSRPLLNAARVILATVDAPAPTLAEELRDVADNYGMSSRAADRLNDIADRVEHDLAEARAEVERLVGNLHTAEHNHAFAAEKWTQMEKERDEARAEVTEWKRRTDRARAEVERLTAERHTERPDGNDWLAGMKDATRYAINATHPNPADVPAGEPWLVRVGGHEALAVRDGDPFWPWSVAHLDGGIDDVADESVTLTARLVPAPRVITNPDELDTLAEGTIIRAKDGDACRKSDGGDWTVDGLDGAVGYGPRQVLPATVLWEPEA